MLLLCTGPDTYRAQQKAHDLERAFIEKYDKQALSVDHLDAGKDAIDEVLRKADSVSLFNPRRFLRIDPIDAAKCGAEPEPHTRRPELKTLIAAVTAWCAGADRLVLESRSVGGSLEEAYLELVGGVGEAT